MVMNNIAQDTSDPWVKKHPSLNPYRIAARELLFRIAWDLRIESWRSRRKIKRIRNTKRGQKAVILCNGPSLNRVDFSELDSVYTFGLNKINLLFDKSAFRPDCIVAVNKYVIEQNREFYEKTEIPLFLDSEGLRHVSARESIAYLPHTLERGFAKDCSMNIYQGHTVTYVAMQLAFHMGFDSVALVGCDHNFATKGPANKAVKSGEVDQSHFDPGYFSGGQVWQLPDLFESEVSYTMARDVFSAHGRTIVNATVGGKLGIFERCELTKFING